MGHVYPSIAASESKAAFMTGIGLVAGNTEHERIYKLMKADAVGAYRRVVHGRWSTTHDGTRNSQPPRYGFTEIPKDVIQEAIAFIYDMASLEIKPYYDRGQDATGNNWVIRWMLWHTFRYRDSRNKRSAGTLDRSEWSNNVQPRESELQVVVGAQALDRTASTSISASPPTHAMSTLPPCASSTPSRPLPYDPVRG